MISLKRRKFIQNTAALALIPIFSACEKKISTEVHEIHWDRDMCARCVMVVSDRNQTVQAINHLHKLHFQLLSLALFLTLIFQ